MAILHGAKLTPTKIELLSAWAPTQPWSDGVDTSVLESVGAFRFDDPDGEVGVETHLLRAADGQIMQVPLTYRAAALEGAADSLITKMHHSVLGERWVYDASVDPVYARTLASTILRGGGQAELTYVTENGPETRPATTHVRGSGSSTDAVPDVVTVRVAHDAHHTNIEAGGLELSVRRVVGPESESDADGAATLIGRWPQHDEWTVLATATRVTN